MTRLLAIASLLVYGVALATPATAQDVDCVAACRIPIEVPEECECQMQTRTGDGTEVADPIAFAILTEMERRYQESIAGVQNYTVVQSSNRSPMPVVHYYEKESFDGTPRFRFVPPSEVAAREQEERGEHTAEDIGDVVGALADLLGGGSDEEERDEDSESSEEESSSDDCLVCSISDKLAEVAASLHGEQTEEIRQAVFDEIIDGKLMMERLEWVGMDSTTVVVGLPDSDPNTPHWDPEDRFAPYYILKGDNLGDIDTGDPDYRIRSMELWLETDYDGTVAQSPMYSKIEFIHVPSGHPVTIEHQKEDYRPAGTMTFAMRVRQFIEGLEILLGQSMAAIEEVTTIHKVLINEGMPSQEEAQRYIDEALTQGESIRRFEESLPDR